MPDTPSRTPMPKALVLVVGAIVIFASYFVSRLSIEQHLAAVGSARVTGLSAPTWDTGSTWTSHSLTPTTTSPFEFRPDAVARTAQIRECTSTFENDLASLRKTVATHRGYFESLRTQAQSGHGWLLSVYLAVPPVEFESTVAELKSIGRLVSISEAGEDANVRLATQARQVTEAQNKLARLERLQKGHDAKLRDALSLEKEIEQAAASVSLLEGEDENVRATVAQSHISLMLAEDYRAPLDAKVDGQWLQIRNASVEGVGAIVSTVGMLLAVVLQYGLPLVFWLAVLYFPVRAIRQYFRRATAPTAAV
jgi:Domain of unknown function (DUF4349)